MGDTSGALGAALGARVFVSYSRDDLDFARQIYLALEAQGFEPLMDTQKINPAEPWQERLTSLIEQCDSVVFVVTEGFLASEPCEFEVTYSRQQGKRMIPILPAPLGDRTVPADLSRLQYVHFYSDPGLPDSGFFSGIRKLEQALQLDLDWLRSKRIYEERAAEWARDELDERLLSGILLEQAQDWAASPPATETIAPAVTRWIAASADVETARLDKEKRLQGKARRRALATFAVGLALATLAVVMSGVSVQNAARVAEANSAQIATEARSLNEDGQHAKGVYAALHGDPAARGNLIRGVLQPNGFPGAQASLQAGVGGNQLRKTFAGHSGSVLSVAFSPDGDRVLTGSDDGTARLWPVPAIMLADPAEQVQIACRMLEDIGFTAFSEEDLLDRPILRTPLIEAPCEDHWRPGAQQDLATE